MSCTDFVILMKVSPTFLGGMLPESGPDLNRITLCSVKIRGPQTHSWSEKVSRPNEVNFSNFRISQYGVDVEECRAATSERLNVTTRHQETLVNGNLSLCCLTFSGLWGPFLRDPCSTKHATKHAQIRLYSDHGILQFWSVISIGRILRFSKTAASCVTKLKKAAIFWQLIISDKGNMGAENFNFDPYKCPSKLEILASILHFWTIFFLKKNISTG